MFTFIYSKELLAVKFNLHLARAKGIQVCSAGSQKFGKTKYLGAKWILETDARADCKVGIQSLGGWHSSTFYN